MLKILDKIFTICLYLSLALFVISFILGWVNGILFFISTLLLSLLPLFFITKANRSKQLTLELKNAIPFSDLEKYIDQNNPILNLSEKGIKQKLNWYNTKLFLGIAFGFAGILLSFLVLPIVLFPIGFWMIFASRNDIYDIRSWFIKNLKIDKVKNIQPINKDIFAKLQPIVLLKKIFLENTSDFDLEVIDFFTFDYKNKKVALINFWQGQSNDDKTKKYYSCLITKNPDKAKGKTLAWSHRKFNLKFKDQDFDENITTESPIFDKLFKVISTNQLEARLHLKTNVMQDMIDLAQTRESILYFDEELIFIITRTNSNLMNTGFNTNIEKQQKQIYNMLNYIIIRKLKIFDEFWLDRKNFKKL